MSQYTIINFIPERYDAKDFVFPLESATNSRYVRIENNSVVLARLGGNQVSEAKYALISPEEGRLIYDTPIDLRADTGELLGHLIIDYYEDTGDHHETELYEVYAFDEAIKIDSKRIDDDRTGKKADDYYEAEHGLITAINPP